MAMVVLLGLVPSAALGAVGPLQTTLAAAGDISCPVGGAVTATTCQDAATAALVSTASPDRVLALGDLQYTNGSAAAFASEYDPVWGAFKATTLPVPGNHEYLTAGASGYFGYWGATAGTAGQGWHATRIGSWLLIGLNSNCTDVGGCGASSAQGQWLEATLAASDAPCQLAYWHHPRFSSGLHGDTADVQPLWEILQAHKAEVVLAGHDHAYERFAPMLADGTVSDAGLASFVVGTGGYDLRAFGAVHAGSQERIAKFGIAVLRLYENGWGAEFRATDGAVYPAGAERECVAATAAPASAATTSTAPAGVARNAQSIVRVRALEVGASRRLPQRSTQGLALAWSSRTRGVCRVVRVATTVGGARRVVSRVRGLEAGTCRLRAVNDGSGAYLPAAIAVAVRVR